MDIQANITGYPRPGSLFSAWDEEKEALVFVVEKQPMIETRREGCLLIGTALGQNPDVLFDDEKLQDSIGAYFALLGGNGGGSQLVFMDKAVRAKPPVESDGVTESGKQYRISPDITAVQVACLATCWYVARRFGAINRTLDGFGLINQARSAAEDMAAGHILRI